MFRHKLYGCKIQYLKVYLVSILITSGVASPTFWGSKNLILGEQQHFVLILYLNAQND